MEKHTGDKKQKSFYHYICDALDQDGHLPPFFSLPDGDKDTGVRFAPGAVDGIGIFHTVKPDNTKLAAQLAKLLESACTESGELGDITAFLRKNNILHIIDPLIDIIHAGDIKITPHALYRIGYRMMTESSQAEAVKLGIAMIGLLNIQDDDKCREALLTLGKCDEFTLYTLVAVTGWKDGNELIFKLAKETGGWGKIHAVERLEPATVEIRDWIIRHGCENEVTNAYLGLTCAEKGDLLSYLRRDNLSPELFRGAEMILEALLDEGPTAGISAYADAEQTIGEYLRHIQGSYALETLSVVLQLKEWLGEFDPAEQAELLERCEEFTAKPQWPALVQQALESGSKAQCWLACTAAAQLDIDIEAALLQLMEDNPIEFADYAAYACRQGIIMETDQLFEIYETALPLEQIATGMGDELGLGPKFKDHSALDQLLQVAASFPGKGLPLIRAGLRTPVVCCRSSALKALEAWIKSENELDDFDPSLRSFLTELYEIEVKDKLKQQISNLLN